MLRIISLLFCSLAISCTVPMPKDGGVAVVTEKPPGATKLGRVSASADGAGVALYMKTYAKAVEIGVAQARSLGASHLVIDKWYREPRFWNGEQIVKGSAYRAY